MGGRKSHNPHRGGSWQSEGRYSDSNDLGGCESMWGYTNTQMPSHIFTWGGVSANYKIRIKSTFLVLYVVFRALNISHNYFINAK